MKIRDGLSASMQADFEKSLSEVPRLRIPASVTGHSGHRDRFAHGHRAGVGFVL